MGTRVVRPQVADRTIRFRWLAIAVTLAFTQAGCAKPADAPPPAPAPVAIAQVPVLEDPLASTIDEARSLLRAGRADDYERSLAAMASSAEPETRRRAAALRALFHFDQKRWDTAAPLLASAANGYPEVAPFLRLRLVDAELARQNLAAAATVAAEVAALPNSSAATVARLRLPVIYAQLEARGESASADAAARTETAWQQAMKVAIDELTEADFVELASGLANAGRRDLAQRTRMRLLTDYTHGRFTEQNYRALTTELQQLPTAEKVALATKLSRANRYDQALELFRQIPGGAPGSRGARLRALFNSRNYGTLLEETAGVKLGDPSLMLLRARAAWRHGKPQEFLAGLAQLEKEYPSSKEAAEAKVLRAKYYITDEIDYPKSVQNLTRAIEAGAVGNDGENIWNLGWTYTLQGNDAQALQTFDRYIRAYPDGDWKTNSLFWSAKILDRLGRDVARDQKAGQILAEFPFSYYSYRAKELWPHLTASRASSATFPDIDAQLSAAAGPRFNTVRELMEIDLNRAAAREMKVLADAHTDNLGVQFMLADVYVRGGEPFRANGVLQRRFRQFVRHGGDGIPQRFWEILYPLAYWETIRKEAERRGVDPFLLASIIRQESGFEPTVVSNAGAVGLMQIMPQEASRIAAAGGLGAVTREDLFNPFTNIAVGAAEYSQKLQSMKGRHLLAIAAYNAGERPVGTWIEKTPVDDIDLFVESIPYAETRLYVKTVTRNRSEYRRIYERSLSSHPLQGAPQ
ncbi:MAG TPA: lytic transglycosylase domain-containing protein [Thermoanaerobaculia bacterium]